MKPTCRTTALPLLAESGGNIFTLVSLVAPFAIADISAWTAAGATESKHDRQRRTESSLQQPATEQCELVTPDLVIGS